MIEQQTKQCLEVVDKAIKFLVDSKKSPRILIKISRNLGDTLHSQPIIRYYRGKYPDACIVFLCEQRFHGVHEYNKDIDGLFLLPNNLEVQTRLNLWNPIKKNKDVDIGVIPAINPFQALHLENRWKQPHPNIVEQFLINAGVDLSHKSPVEVIVDDNDKRWAAGFMSGIHKAVAIEYVSYSIPLAWKMPAYTQFVQLANARGYKCLSLAGKNEPLIPGTLDARGASWRQTTALLARCQALVGCSSGNTMLALAARPQPTLIELNPPEDCIAANTGYLLPGTRYHRVTHPTPASIAALL